MRIILIAVFCACFCNATAQLTVADIKALELGQTFEDMAEPVAAQFNNNITFYEGNAHDAYRIVCPEADSSFITKKNRAIFDTYGGAKVTYQFAEGRLIAVEIRFEFTAEQEEKERFAHTLQSMVNDFAADADFIAWRNPQGEAFDTGKIIQEVKTGCDRAADNARYQEQKGMLGAAAWEVHKRVNNIPRHKWVTLQVFKTFATSYAYSGCVTVAELVVTNEHFINLYNTIQSVKIAYEEMDTAEEIL